MLKLERQNLMAGPSQSTAEKRKQNDEKALYQSALIQNPNRKLIAQCRRTEMEVIMKGSFKKKKKKTGPTPLLSVTCCQMVICAAIFQGSSDNTRLSIEAQVEGRGSCLGGWNKN